MQKKLRIFAIIIGAAFLIFLTLNMLLNRLLSEERLMAMLIEPAQKAIGREVTLGSLDVSLLRGITITDINIKERNGKQNFVSIKTFRLSYELLPLLRKHLVIKEILIDEPQIRIIRGSDNKFNFADIAQQHEEKPAELIPADDNNGLEQLPLTMTFDRININKATLTLTDQTNILPEIHSEADLTMSVALGKTLAETTYSGSVNLLVNGKYRKHKPVLQLTCAFTEKLISYQGHLTLGFDKGEVNGWVDNYLATPDIELNLKINSLDLNALASLEQLLNDNSGQQQPKSAQAARPTNSSQPAKAAPIDLQLAAHGKVNIGQVSRDSIKVRDISLVYRLKDNIIAMEAIEALLFGGKIKGDLSADIGREQPVFQGKINVEGIKVAEIMIALDKPAESLSGVMASNLTFKGNGKEWSVIKKSLNGKGSFSLVNGGLQRTPLTTALATLLGIPELNDLRFDDFSGDITIANGKIALDANLQSQGVSIQAKGNVGLDGSLQMPLTLRLSPEYSKRSSVTRYLADDRGRATLYLHAKGSIQKPKLTIDSKGVNKQVSKAVKQGIMKELGRAIDKNRPTNNTGGSADPVKDASQMLFKKLFGN